MAPRTYSPIFSGGPSSRSRKSCRVPDRQRSGTINRDCGFPLCPFSCSAAGTQYKAAVLLRNNHFRNSNDNARNFHVVLIVLLFTRSATEGGPQISTVSKRRSVAHNETGAYVRSAFPRNSSSRVERSFKTRRKQGEKIKETNGFLPSFLPSLPLAAVAA